MQPENTNENIINQSFTNLENTNENGKYLEFTNKEYNKKRSTNLEFTNKIQYDPECQKRYF